MAKSPRKGASASVKSGYSQKLNPKLYKTPRYGGKGMKNLSGYNFQPQPNRRLSIAESASSESSDGIAGLSGKYPSRSDSESSLTAMSEDDESVASRKGLVFFENPDRAPTKTVGGNQRLRKSKPPKSARKKVSRKVYKAQTFEMSSDDDKINEEDDDSDDANDDDDENDVAVMDYLVDDDNEDVTGLEGIYSMVETSGRRDSDSDLSSDSPDSEDNQNDYSSSDDSEVDFVQLQAERRAKSMKTLRAIKGLPKPPAEAEVNKQPKRRRSSVYRRRSEVALPEGINFKFEFDDATSGEAINEDDEEGIDSVVKSKAEEEDIGEEVAGTDYDFNFNIQYSEPVMDVPKFKDDEFNSDDEYDFDDNDLLATLQADNDLDEFITGDQAPPKPRTRQSSMSSANDDTEDHFLREEEKYLVNEFETNGFDDDHLETAKVMNSFKDNTDSQKKQVLQYASSSDDSQFGSDIEDDTRPSFDVEDDSDEIDFIDFDTPFSDKRSSEDVKQEKAPIQSPQKSKKKRPLPKSHKRKGPLDSEEEDDSYLWNYFLSSGADSENESETEGYDLEEQFLLEELFRQDLEEKNSLNSQIGIVGNEVKKESSLEPAESDHEYDSGESTDLDLSLPTSTNTNQAGSKVAKEVLSSKTADYRPPVLGTWVAVDCKPFGIIDGLSTRTLNQQSNAKNPRSNGWRTFSLKPDSEDSAIELDELLNISELDNDDENDIRIWRDFNNNKKHVPLGAFRNKLHINQSMIVPEPMTGFSTSKMNTDFNSGAHKNPPTGSEHRVKKPTRKPSVAHATGSTIKDGAIPSKLKRRRQSNADAVSEGFRPTKSGLFSENVLADVEEVLGDDRDFMALIQGL